MLRIRCDICGKWSLLSSTKLQHFKSGKYVSHDVKKHVDKKGREICEACLRNDERNKARRTEREERKTLLARPHAEAWYINYNYKQSLANGISNRTFRSYALEAGCTWNRAWGRAPTTPIPELSDE